MTDLPLHPMIVHFPIVLGALLPVVGLILWWAIRKEFVQPKAWALMMILTFLYAGSAVVAVELGEDDEDKVEKVIEEKYIEEHEEAGGAIPWIAGVLFVMACVGFTGAKSQKFRLVFCALSLLAIVPLVNAGHTGGELVYEYGAANAHLSPERWNALKSGSIVVGKHEEHEEEDDD